MKLKTLAVTLFSLFAVNAYSQDFNYFYKLYINPTKTIPIKVGEASVSCKKDTIFANIDASFLKLINIHLNLAYDFETEQYFENNTLVNVSQKTKNPLITYLELLDTLRTTNSLDSLHILYLLTIGSQTKILELTHIRNINGDVSELEIKATEGDMGVKNIESIRFYYSRTESNITKAYATIPGPSPNIKGKLKSK